MPGLELSDGATLNYEVAGDGPTVTLIHPGLWDMRTWDREVPQLRDTAYRTVRYDVRGYGGSSRPEPDDSYSHVRDLERLLDATEVVQTALVGCSMGGGIALDFALEHPERVWALVLVATALGGYEATEEEEEWDANAYAPVDAALEDGDPERALDLELTIWASLGTDDDAGRRIREIAFDNIHQLSMAEGGKERLDPPAAHRLAELDVPALILDAEHDPPFQHRIADLLTKEIVGARMEVVEGSDHVINMRQPGRFDELVLPFLASAAPP